MKTNKYILLLLCLPTIFLIFGCKDKSEESPVAEKLLTEGLVLVDVLIVDQYNDELEAGVVIYPAGENEKTWEGIAPAQALLEPGKYDIEIKYTGAERRFTGHTISDKKDKLEFQLNTGALKVVCYSSGGEPVSGEVMLFSPGYSGQIPFKYAETGEEISLLPGDYDVAIKTQGTILPRHNITISEKAILEEKFILDTGYIIVNVVDNNGRAVDGEIRVYPAGDYNSTTTTGYISDVIPVRPGSYDIVVVIKTPDGTYKERSVGVSVVSNQTTEERLTVILPDNG